MLDNTNTKRTNNQNSAQNVQKKIARDVGEPAQKVNPQNISSNPAKTQSQGIANKMEKIVGGNKNEPEQLDKNMDRKKQNMKYKQDQKPTWEQNFHKAQTNIKRQLKSSNADLSTQLHNVYQGILKNCLKQSQEEPHKLQNCLDEFSTKMKPIYKQMEQKSTQSVETLKKCFQSKKNAQECIQEGIRFGKLSLLDATNSLQSYLT